MIKLFCIKGSLNYLSNFSFNTGCIRSGQIGKDGFMYFLQYLINIINCKLNPLEIIISCLRRKTVGDTMEWCTLK